MTQDNQQDTMWVAFASAAATLHGISGPKAMAVFDLAHHVIATRYKDALREAQDALLGWESRNGGMHMRSENGRKAIATITSLLGEKK